LSQDILLLCPMFSADMWLYQKSSSVRAPRVPDLPQEIL
jgi:hypothetical protein